LYSIKRSKKKITINGEIQKNLRTLQVWIFKDILSPRLCISLQITLEWSVEGFRTFITGVDLLGWGRAGGCY